MSETIDLERTVTGVRTAAKECSALIIEATLVIETSAVPVVAIAASEFPGVIKHLRPRLIYLFVSPFDAGDEALAALDVEDEEESYLESAPIKKLISKWRHRHGQICRVSLGLMGDGVLHVSVEEADWFAEFEDETRTLTEAVEQAREEQEQKLRTEERKRLLPMIKQLMADSRFSGPKVGVAKRTALAESLFPDLDRDVIREIVDKAESEHWLATAAR